MTTAQILLIIWLVWNIITFVLMGIDKLMAKVDGVRISEANLLGSAFLMGALGSFLGSKAFNHKTRKQKFRRGLPAALAVNIIVIILIIYFY